MHEFCFPSDVEPQQTLVDLYNGHRNLIRLTSEVTGNAQVNFDERLFMRSSVFGGKVSIEFHFATGWNSQVLGRLFPDGTWEFSGNHRRGDWQRSRITRAMPWLDWGWHNGFVLWYPAGYWGETRRWRPKTPRDTTCIQLGMTGIPDRMVRDQWRPPKFRTIRNSYGYPEFVAVTESPEHWAAGPKRSTDRRSPRSNNMYLGNLVNEDAAAAFATFLEVKDVHHLAPVYSEDPAMASA